MACYMSGGDPSLVESEKLRHGIYDHVQWARAYIAMGDDWWLCMNSWLRRQHSPRPPAHIWQPNPWCWIWGFLGQIPALGARSSHHWKFMHWYQIQIRNTWEILNFKELLNVAKCVPRMLRMEGFHRKHENFSWFFEKLAVKLIVANTFAWQEKR